jgi:hypothetical protein
MTIHYDASVQQWIISSEIGLELEMVQCQITLTR